MTHYLSSGTSSDGYCSRTNPTVFINLNILANVSDSCIAFMLRGQSTTTLSIICPSYTLSSPMSQTENFIHSGPCVCTSRSLLKLVLLVPKSNTCSYKQSAMTTILNVGWYIGCMKIVRSSTADQCPMSVKSTKIKINQ